MRGRPSRRDLLDLEFARLVSVPGSPAPAALLGVEQEFSVRIRGRPVDFRPFVGRATTIGPRLDPGDPLAHRCRWGGVVTADGAEAETATPPVRLGPGFARTLTASTDMGRREIEALLPEGFTLRGYSTHLNASMPAGLNDRLCGLYAETFAPSLMLLTDGPASPGLLIRPRPGRTELGTEFVDGYRLAAASAFVAGSVRVCASALRGGRRHRRSLPPRLRVRAVPARHRYGLYVDRAAFGVDLHSASRRTLLPLASGRTISAQSHLEASWSAAREALEELAEPADLAAADLMVAKALPLPAESSHPATLALPAAGPERRVEETFGSAVRARRRPGFDVLPVSATWDFTIWRLAAGASQAFACVPRGSLPGFLSLLDDGGLDAVVRAYLAASPSGRLLGAHGQTLQPGLYDDVQDEHARLLAPERDPETGRVLPASSRAGKGGSVRPGKRERREPPQERERVPAEGDGHRPWVRRFLTVPTLLAVVGVLLVAGVTAAIASRAHHPAPVPLPAGPTPTTLTTPVTSGGGGSTSPPTSPSPGPDVPGAPTDLAAVAGDGSATLTWRAPGGNGGRRILGYTIVVEPGSIARTTDRTHRTVTITGLRNGTSYTFTVAARNRVGTGPAARSIPFTPTATAPVAALTVTVSGGGNDGTVLTDPGGIDCPGTCAAPFPTDAVVTLRASPTGSNVFTGWGGDCASFGTRPDCILRMGAPRSVSASFAPFTPILTVSVEGAGVGSVQSLPTGIDCPGTCEAPFSTGAVVTLTAKATGNNYFGGWGGACAGTGGCTVTMDDAQTVTASFLPPPQPLTVTVQGRGSGQVTSSPAGVDCSRGTCYAVFPGGTVVTLTATPSGNSNFAGWGGACAGTEGCTVTMDAARTVTAEFEPIPPG